MGGKPAGSLDQDALVAKVLEHLSDVAGAEAGEQAAEAVESFAEEFSVRLPREHAVAVLQRLKDDEATSFEMIMDITCVHFPKRPEPLGAFDVVYHLVSLSKAHRIRLKVACSKPEEGVDSAVPVWSGSNLLEREAYDMFGVHFRGHPDLRRILLGDDFQGWPLRKDFPYRGH
jgi:NADH-quinone oxidoreductase subunit C